MDDWKLKTTSVVRLRRTSETFVYFALCWFLIGTLERELVLNFADIKLQIQRIITTIV